MQPQRVARAYLEDHNMGFLAEDKQLLGVSDPFVSYEWVAEQRFSSLLPHCIVLKYALLVDLRRDLQYPICYLST
jgi:DNA-binding transcriptional ArsR family regulator